MNRILGWVECNAEPCDFLACGFGLVDPVVLVVVEDGDEDVEMPEKLAQRDHVRKLHREIRALAPLREHLIQRMMRGANENRPALLTRSWSRFDWTCGSSARTLVGAEHPLGRVSHRLR